jgi:hypothetical protein
MTERQFIKHIAIPVDLLNRHTLLQQVISDLENLEIRKEDYPADVPVEQIQLATEKRNITYTESKAALDAAQLAFDTADDDAKDEMKAGLEAAQMIYDKAIDNAERVLQDDLERAGQAAARQAEEKYQSALDERADALKRAKVEFGKADKEYKKYGDQPMDEDEIAETLAREKEWNAGAYSRDLERVRTIRRGFYEAHVDPLVAEANRLADGPEKDSLIAEANAEVASIKKDYPKPDPASYAVSEGGTKPDAK